MSPARLEASDLYFRYEDRIQALKGVSLALEPGHCLALIGANGSGKTTLVKCLAGLLRPQLGAVRLGDKPLEGLRPPERARAIGFVFQSPDHQIFSSTTAAEIAYGLRNLGLADREVKGRTRSAMEAFGLLPFADQAPAALSFGLRRKVTVASVIAMRPAFLIMDEPTLGLDRRTANELMAVVRSLQQQGTSVAIVSHDLRLVARFADRCALMNDGRITAYGPTTPVLGDVGGLQAAGLVTPPVVELALALTPYGFDPTAITARRFADAYCALLAAHPE
jgi:energy-coupling factor transporter ATP-binding protein EcfA2